jgi:hypothetical protein
MIRLLADENFNGRILRGVRRERLDADSVRVQDTVIYQAPDPQVLAWAAEERRILLTHDVETMVGYAKERLSGGLPMPGIIVVRDTLPVGPIIEDLLIILDASDMSD